ncbi:MAG: hypothetical protein ACO23H_08335 [Alphaproteobacteria bacterium]|jgi:hypothetical protein
MTKTISDILDEAKSADYTGIMVLGLNDKGGMTINSSMNNIALMHWMLNKSIFDINVFEREPKQVDQESKEE